MPTVYVTAPPERVADIARTPVEERLAAGVNRVPSASTYRWDGEIHEDEEAILFVKTTTERYSDLRARIEELHPYDVPCIERFDADDVAAPFAAWIRESVE
jgi:periplasmic divalent cation tolerance protein